MFKPDLTTQVPIALALLILRLSLAGFLLLWGLDKLLAPFATVITVMSFYGLSINSTLAMIAGAAEVVLALAMMVGLFKTLSYGLGMLLHISSVIVTHKQWLAPFGDNHLFIAALPLLGAFIVLFLLRKADTLWSVDSFRKKRRQSW